MKKITEIFSKDEIKKLKPLMFLAGVCVLALIVITLMPSGKSEEKSVSANKTEEAYGILNWR